MFKFSPKLANTNWSLENFEKISSFFQRDRLFYSLNFTGEQINTFECCLSHEKHQLAVIGSKRNIGFDFDFGFQNIFSSSFWQFLISDSTPSPLTPINTKGQFTTKRFKAVPHIHETEHRLTELVELWCYSRGKWLLVMVTKTKTIHPHHYQ